MAKIIIMIILIDIVITIIKDNYLSNITREGVL